MGSRLQLDDHIPPGTGLVGVNGEPNLHLEARPGETVRLRLIDAIQETGFSPSDKVQAPVLSGARYSIVALDGHDLNQPQEQAARQLEELLTNAGAGLLTDLLA